MFKKKRFSLINLFCVCGKQLIYEGHILKWTFGNNQVNQNLQPIFKNPGVRKHIYNIKKLMKKSRRNLNIEYFLTCKN